MRASFLAFSVFRRMSSMLSLSTPPLVRSLRHTSASCYLTHPCRYSDGGSILPAFIGRLRVSSVCSCDVLCARIWKGGHGTRRGSHRHRLSCVSLSFKSRMMPSIDSPAFLDPLFSGILEKGYERRVVMPSDECMEWRLLEPTHQNVWIRFGDR